MTDPDRRSLAVIEGPLPPERHPWQPIDRPGVLAERRFIQISEIGSVLQTLGAKPMASRHRVLTVGSNASTKERGSTPLIGRSLLSAESRCPSDRRPVSTRSSVQPTPFGEIGSGAPWEPKSHGSWHTTELSTSGATTGDPPAIHRHDPTRRLPHTPQLRARLSLRVPPRRPR